VLLAPATADAVVSLLGGDAPEIDVSAFSPRRFTSPGKHAEVAAR
jgi:glycine/D-amino acid oxidase-like deaminating enzyme